ncbi:LytR/AlgR family response regulator transcription factor [Ramlibacter sp. PS4R-6]|uniref:LytR/AlgR family response regulator transcription factor n=1 Tax=Ramlibacter sp. PS4R-6 TaxID=3133438 RepID=UPI0030B09465
MSGPKARALVADDEPLLREELIALLARAWPELEVVAQARNGREAVEQFEAHEPDICFLDVHMPGMTGIEAAQKIGNRAHLVFVTAFEQYALKAFEHGAHDYIVKPVDANRLATTVARLKERVGNAAPSAISDELLRELAARLRGEGAGAEPLRWIRASSRGTLRMIPVDDIDFLKSDEKYTLVAWRDEGQAAEALISTPLKQLIGELDAVHFVQIHRSVVVNLRSVRHVTRGENETATVHLKGRDEQLPVSRSYLHVFRQM